MDIASRGIQADQQTGFAWISIEGLSCKLKSGEPIRELRTKLRSYGDHGCIQGCHELVEVGGGASNISVGLCMRIERCATA
jgi:hypothetical protein